MVLNNISLNNIISKFHDSLQSFSNSVQNVININKSTASTEEITTIRDHLKTRLLKGDEDAENKKLIKLLELLSKDQAVLNLIKEESDEWIEMLDAIEQHVKSRDNTLNSDDLKKIIRLSSDIKSIVRK
jgi:transcriptional regulator of heat shock response